ncbi:5-formyltetrahydrofolate cyclo-ligase [Neptunomonas sp.]|uniref:5-formyltetrahydrofolate cyclo-ligase n=1 Tax=Neptunomonas sp. TaxID=1971898 RepID=UPI00356130AE
MDARSTLRQSMRQKRRALSPQQQAAAAHKLLTVIKKLPDIHKSKHLAIYLPNDGELDPTPIVQWCWKMKKNVYLPVLHPLSHNRLWFVRYTHRTLMTRNIYGILEPKAPYRFIRPAKMLDIVLLPLVAFDEQGGRLGMGGGYYDRTFSFIRQYNAQRPRLIGLAHDLQKVKKLPIESWDVPLSCIVTEARCY